MARLRIDGRFDAGAERSRPCEEGGVGFQNTRADLNGARERDGVDKAATHVCDSGSKEIRWRRQCFGEL